MGPERSWIAVGRVRRPHGVKGELLVDIETDFPERLHAGVAVGLGDVAPGKECTVETVRLHKGAWLLGLQGVASRNDAEALRDQWLFLPEMGRTELPENYYYEHELVGARCELPGGELLGRVVALTHGPGRALLSVEPPGGGEVVLVPFVSPIVVRVEPEEGRVLLDPPVGLFGGDAL